MDLCSSCCSWKKLVTCSVGDPPPSTTDTTLTIDRELGSSRYCFRLRLFPFTWNATGWKSNQTGPTLTVRGTQVKHRPVSGCRSSWGRHRRCLWTAGTQTRTAGAETKNMDLCHWCWCPASLCWLIHPWEVVELDLYLLSCIHGDGQAVWHQTSSLVLFHQPHRHHRYTHLTSSRAHGQFKIQTKENYTNSSIFGHFCLLRLPWCLYQTGLRRNITSSWRCRVVPAAGCLWAERMNKLAEKRCLKRGRWWTEADERPVLSPFIRISSLGTVWNSLWYWELYLLTVCGGSEPRSQNSNNQWREWPEVPQGPVLHPF